VHIMNNAVITNLLFLKVDIMHFIISDSLRGIVLTESHSLLIGDTDWFSIEDRMIRFVNRVLNVRLVNIY